MPIPTRTELEWASPAYYEGTHDFFTPTCAPLRRGSSGWLCRDRHNTRTLETCLCQRFRRSWLWLWYEFILTRQDALSRNRCPDDGRVCCLTCTPGLEMTNVKQNTKCLTEARSRSPNRIICNVRWGMVTSMPCMFFFSTFSVCQ